jgi:hypothetical protein
MPQRAQKMLPQKPLPQAVHAQTAPLTDSATNLNCE